MSELTECKPVACIHCGGKGYWKSGVNSEAFVCLCKITDTDAVFYKCPKYPTAPLNTLDADTTTRMRLVLDKLGIENKHFEDLPPYLFVLLGQARRKIEKLQNPSPLTQEEMRNVLDALKIGHDNGYWLAQCSEVSDQSDDILKDQKSISAAIAILKGHLHE